MELFGSVFWYLGLTSPSSDYNIQKNSKKTVFYSKNRCLKKNGYFFQKKNSFFCSSSQSAHRHRHDEKYYAADVERRRRTWSKQALPAAIKFKKNQKNRFLLKQMTIFLFLFFFEFYHRVPIATGMRIIICCRRGAPQAH